MANEFGDEFLVKNPPKVHSLEYLPLMPYNWLNDLPLFYYLLSEVKPLFIDA
jgi:hypothetical protein